MQRTQTQSTPHASRPPQAPIADPGQLAGITAAQSFEPFTQEMLDSYKWSIDVRNATPARGSQPAIIVTLSAAAASNPVDRVVTPLIDQERASIVIDDESFTSFLRRYGADHAFTEQVNIVSNDNN